MITSSSRRTTSRFHPGMAAMYARTGASPSPLAICGLSPERSLGFFFAAAAGVRFEMGFRLALARVVVVTVRADFEVLRATLRLSKPNHRSIPCPIPPMMKP